MNYINKYSNPAVYSLIFLASFLFLQCTPIANYNPVAYEQAVTLKVESLEVMRLATGDYSRYEEIVKELNRNLNIAYEFSRGRPYNEISTKQWEILLDPGKNLLGGFLKRWKENGTVSEMFIDEMKRIISDAFDTIIGLESGKIKPSEIN